LTCSPDIVDYGNRRSVQNLVYDLRRYYGVVGPFLDAELAGRGDERFWLEVGRRARAGSILELGCGGGRVTRVLAESGARVVGIDLCPELLERARQRLDTHAVSLVVADMRQLALRRRFEAIVAPDDPFSHLTADEDRSRALAGVARHLAPGGRFVLDALWFPPDEERRGSRLLTHDLTLAGQAVHVTERWRCDRQTHCCATEYDYYTGAGEPTHASFEARYWTPAELRDRLAAAGLHITHWWGGYDGQPWDEQRSERLVLEAISRQPSTVS